MEQVYILKRRLQKWSILCLVWFLPAFSLFSQERTVTGTVSDMEGAPLIGVSVVIQNTTQGTLTDLDGKFSITVPGDDAVLVFSYIGFLKEEITVGKQSLVNVRLVPDITSLDEVVVIGYGIQKKKLVTGATVQVKNEDMVKNHVTRLESSLQGLTPGMVIVKQSGQPGSDYNINIRGLSSPNDNNPLVLIDGVPGSLNFLNPSDIESVDILKDAASAAIYGSRAGNGVILVTTKKGKSGEPQLTYDFYYGISNPSRKIEMLNAQEYAMILNEGYFNISPNGTNPPFSQAKIDSINSLGHTGTDWQDEAMTKNAGSQSHYLNLSGGGEFSTYSISISYNNEEGVYNFENKSNYERVGFRVNSEHKLKKIVKVGENLTYMHRTSRGLGVGNQYNNFMRSLLEASPLIDVYDPNMPDGYGRSTYNVEQINPIASMHYNYNGKNNNDDIIGNVYAEIEILKGLKFKSDLGGSIRFQNNSNYTDTFTLSPFNERNVPTFEQYMSRDFFYNFDNTLTYEKSINDHNLLVLTGINAQDNRFFNMKTNADGFLSSSARVITNVADIDTVVARGDYGNGDSRFSYFGRLGYNYKEKYLLSFSTRWDYSSRFGPNNRKAWFPAVSAGWVISEEDFFKPLTWLGYFKVRGSWGKNGKEPFQPYRFLATVGNTDRYYTFGGIRVVGVSPNILANPNLRWEASEQVDIGFDSRFFNDFRFSFDWYKKTSKDWILPNPVAGITGIEAISPTNPFINAGSVVNQGIEFELGYFKTISNGLSVDISANMAYNKNEVTEVPGEIIHGSSSVIYNGSSEFYRVEEGYPIGYFWGYKTDGIFQTQEEVNNYTATDGRLLQGAAKPGDVKRVDLNEDGVINDNDKTMIGDPNPDFIYGMNLGFLFKGVDFSVNLQGMGGHQIVKAYKAEERTYYNYTSDYLDRWRWIDANENKVIDPGEGTSKTSPRVTQGNDPNSNWRRFSDLYVHDADFLRIKSINLGYDFKTLLKALPVGQFRVYVSATNLFTFTKYNGLDPEVGYGSYYDSQGNLQDAYASGIDLGTYPSSRTYLVGINVKF